MTFNGFVYYYYNFLLFTQQFTHIIQSLSLSANTKLQNCKSKDKLICAYWKIIKQSWFNFRTLGVIGEEGKLTVSWVLRLEVD